MRIAFISFFYTGTDTYGASIETEKILVALSSSKEKIQVDFYCPYPVRKFKKVPNVNYIFISVINIPLLRYFSFTFNCAQRVSKNKPYDIIHSINGASFFIRNFDFETFHHSEAFSLKILFEWISYFIATFPLHKARNVLAISEKTLHDLTDKEKIDKKRCFVLQDAIDCNIFNPNHDVRELKTQMQRDPNEKIMMFIGNLLSRKKPQLALKTLNYLLKKGMKARLILIGSGPLETKLHSYASTLGINGQLDFIPHADEVYPYYSISDIILIPSRLEGFGYIYLEGPACGLKFVGFDTGIAKIAAQNGLGEIASDDTDFMQKSFKILEQNERIDDDGFRFINDNYSLETYGRKLMAIYKVYVRNKSAAHRKNKE